MIKSLKVQLKEKLAKNIGLTIEEIDKILSSDSAIYNKFVLLKSRYYSSKSEFDQGIVMDNDYRIVSNQIRKSFLSLIDEITPIDIENTISKKVAETNVVENYDYKNYQWSEKIPYILETFDSENTSLITFGEIV